MRKTLLALLPITALTALAALLSLPAVSLRADSPAPSAASVEDLAWLAGKWQGEAFGGTVEEYWDRPWGGTMIGTFKVAVEGSVTFYELMTITVDSGVPKLRVKHFNPDLSSWEDKDSSTVFGYLGGAAGEVRFGGLTYRLVSDDSLSITINLGHTEGTRREVTIDCVRVDTVR